MKDQEIGGHLAPETFIDLAEGVPVEASHRLHVERCEGCRGELEELRRTLALLNAVEQLDSGEADVPATRPRARGLGLWLVAAAAILVALVVSYPKVRPEGVLAESNGAGAPTESLLPPTEGDEAFQLLLALTEELDGSDVLADETGGTGLVLREIDELTPEERGILLERLAEEMRSSS